MMRILGGLLLSITLLAQDRPADRPKVMDDPEVQGLYQACAGEQGCKIVSRNVKVLVEKNTWVYEPIIFVRTASVIDPTVARFKSKAGTGYIVLLIPSHTVDAALIKLLEGK